MTARYVLREGSRGGERYIAVADDAVDLFGMRDHLRQQFSSRSRVFDVIDTDATDPPESGIVEQCITCGRPFLASAEDGSAVCPSEVGS